VGELLFRFTATRVEPCGFSGTVEGAWAVRNNGGHIGCTRFLIESPYDWYRYNAVSVVYGCSWDGNLKIYDGENIPTAKLTETGGSPAMTHRMETSTASASITFHAGEKRRRGFSTRSVHFEL
jgi:hypothetical protein